MITNIQNTVNQNTNPKKEEKEATIGMIKEEMPESRDFSSKVFRAVDKFLDLGAKKDISLKGLNSEEKDQYYKIIAKLMQKGIVGYNYYEIDGQTEKHYIDVSLGNQRLERGKKLNDRYY
jgi:hypothetical protein